MTGRRRAHARRSARTRRRTRRRPRWDAFCACAHTYAYTRMHCCVHTYARTHVPSRARLVRARSRPARPRVGASARPCERGGAGTHSVLRLGQLAAAGSAASSVLVAYLRANHAAAPGGPGPPLTARRSAARASHACAGLGRGRRPATPPPPHPTPRSAAPAPRRGSASRSSAAPANAHGGGGGRGTHRVSKSLHRPSESGSACTFVEEMDLPRTARACGPRPPRDELADVGQTGRSHGKSLRMP